MRFRSGIYTVPTNRGYIERTVWLIAGAASLVVALAGFCIMANGLYWLGAEPRLAPAPDGRQERPIDLDHPTTA